MPPYNLRRTSDPQLLPRLLFFLQALLWYGDEDWLWRVVDIAYRTATTEEGFDLGEFLYHFRIEISIEADNVHRRIYHRVDRILRRLN
jgi:hypothetical protein